MASVESEVDAESKKASGCRRFSIVEKMLFFIAIFGFLMCITLLIGLGIMVSNHIDCNKTTSGKIQKREIPLTLVTINSADKVLNPDEESREDACREICSSSSCQNEASFFLRNMDETIDPCDDFYQFVCGNFIKNTTIPEDANKIDMFSITQKNVIAELKEEIKEKIKDNELSAFKKLKIYYQNCMNETRVETEGTKNLLQILMDLGGWPVLLGSKWKDDDYVWAESVYKIKDYGYPLLFPVVMYIGGDPKNTTKSIVKIISADTRVVPSYMLDGPNSKILKAYYDYMVDLAVMLGADKDDALREMKDCLDFEVEIYKIKITTEELINPDTTFNPMTIRDLSEKYPTIPWLKLLNRIMNSAGITVEEEETVILMNPEFIVQLEKLIARTPKRVLANYLLWQVVHDSVDYLSDSFLDRQLQFFRVARGVKERKARPLRCVQDVMEGFTVSLSALYVRKHFGKELKEEVQELIRNVKNQFREMLREVDWMDEETRGAALDKIDAMEVFVAYSDELFDDEKIDSYYEDLDVDYGSYLKSAFNVSLFFTKQYYGTLRRPVDKQDWTLIKNAAIINAYYYVYKNAFEIPAGILRGSFFRLDRPKYLNYGAIGSVIGHEITHGFDNFGRKSDKNGNQNDWWQKDTQEKYVQKANCMVAQYSNYTVEEVGLKVNGNRTQAENIADNGGYKAAYHAYVNYALRNNLREPCLPGLNYTARQMFWIGAASTRCRRQKAEYLRDAVSRDLHSPSMARVNIPFSNFREFARDFGCGLGSRMNPVEKCVVW